MTTPDVRGAHQQHVAALTTHDLTATDTDIILDPTHAEYASVTGRWNSFHTSFNPNVDPLAGWAAYVGTDDDLPLHGIGEGGDWLP